MNTNTDRVLKYTQAHDALLQEAISRPGVREAMEVYQNWRKVDEALARYSQVTVHHSKVTASDRANIL
jgi:hypothetical protein